MVGQSWSGFGHQVQLVFSLMVERGHGDEFASGSIVASFANSTKIYSSCHLVSIPGFNVAVRIGRLP